MQLLEKDRRQEEKKPVTEQDIMLKRHSEELHELQSKLQRLESVFSNKKGASFILFIYNNIKY